MSKKEKLFQNIENNLDTLQVHIKKMQKENFKLHSIDVDLLKKKTLDLYEKLHELDTEVTENRGARSINLPEKMPKAEIPEKTSTQFADKEVHDTILKDEVKNTLQEKTTEVEVKTEIPKKEIIEEKPIFTPVVEDESLKPETNEDPVSKVSEEVSIEDSEPTNVEEERDATQSAFDLFSAGGEATVADKLGSNDKTSVADRMQKRQVIDLRQAIGINEKFLFINELFNGDMGRYNKAIDELNDLKTQQGINTYLLELKVANQWSEENEAYLKFKSLLERKSN
jgi:hypothetical protein